MTALISSKPPSDPIDALTEYFGHSGFRPGQEAVVRAVLAGDDVLAVMPTGAGKSLCYQLPAMMDGAGCTVVVSPLVALMKDQVDSLPDQLRQRAAVFNSTVDRGDLDAATADLIAGKLRLVYVAPERLRQRSFVHALTRARISRFVVDEAHCVSLWGHDFRPDYLFIPTVVEMLGAPPVLAMTATATPALKQELSLRFQRPLRIIDNGVLRPNLYLDAERLENKDAKHRRLVELCQELRGPGIIYAGSRQDTEEIAGILRRHGVSARHYHAGLDREERANTQDSFMRGQTRVIVATVAFGMGVNKADVRFIIHFGPSRSLEAYAQESGRAGRDGEPARCVLLWTSSDRSGLRRNARRDALSRDILRSVYKAIRANGNGRWAWWTLDALAAATARHVTELDPERLTETDIRVALGALEQAGVLRRHCDLPEAARVGKLHPQPLVRRGERADTLLGWDDGDTFNDESWMEEDWGDPAEPPESVQEPAAAGEGEDSVPVWLATLTDALGDGALLRDAALAADLSPADVEEALLAEQDAGLITYRPLGRGLLLELLPHPADLAERLRQLLERHEHSLLERAEEMIAYAQGRVCRAAAIARHFGVAHPGRCGNCDICHGNSAAPAAKAFTRPERTLAPEDVLLACVATLPFPMGRRGLVRVLRGDVSAPLQADRSEYFGMLADLPVKMIEQLIDRLTEAGYLAAVWVERNGMRYQQFAITEAGLAKEPGEAEPEPAAPPRSGTREQGSRNRERGPRGQGGVAVMPAQIADEDPRYEARREALWSWRREESRAQGKSAFIIASNAALEALARTLIRTQEEIPLVPGWGPKKADEYGAALVALLADL